MDGGAFFPYFALDQNENIMYNRLCGRKNNIDRRMSNHKGFKECFIMKKIIALIAAVAMIAATVTACGNNNNSSASVGSSAPISESK